uniref:Uncharacterized protein n=1 Tax=Tanacetum cinerariifolium TaxID=118510 RepID=A0A6L2JAB3_TANCI|nr:hypothetical protein [Tanacetum cinerariifolium]
MDGYKIKFFRGMTYDKVRPIFEREYKKVQSLFKPDKDVHETKTKRVADETLLQESFKKLRAAENMLEIIPVPEFKVEALQVKYPIIDWEIHTEGFDREDLVALWNLVKEKFGSAVPSEDKEKALWAELKRLFEPDADDVLWKLQRYMHAPLTWKLYSDCGVHHVSSTRGHDIFMLTEKDYPLSNAVTILMLNSEEFVNLFVRIGFGSTIKLVSFDEGQVVTFNGKFVCGFRNIDCGTGSRSDNTIGIPHGFIIYGIEVFEGNEEVMEVIDVENWRKDNSRVLRWVVSLIVWNSSVSLTKSSIQSTFGFG